MADTTIKVKLNENVKLNDFEIIEIVEAISYMYGITIIEARRTLEKGHYTRADIYKAIAYFRTVGLPTGMKSEYAKKELPNVIRTYENLI